jgi:hypothetical protein
VLFGGSPKFFEESNGSILLSLLCDPEYEGDIFLRNVRICTVLMRRFTHLGEMMAYGVTREAGRGVRAVSSHCQLSEIQACRIMYYAKRLRNTQFGAPLFCT